MSFQRMLSIHASFLLHGSRLAVPNRVHLALCSPIHNFDAGSCFSYYLQEMKGRGSAENWMMVAERHLPVVPCLLDLQPSRARMTLGQGKHGPNSTATRTGA